MTTVRQRSVTRDRYLSDAELEQFMAAVRERRHKNQPRDHAFFAILANTGIRPAEALRLTRADLHLKGRPPWFQLHRTRRPHGPSPVNELIVNPRVAAVVRLYAETLTGDPSTRPWPFTRRQAARLFHFYSNKAGVDQRFRIYDLRHTFGIRLWRHTKDVRLIQGIMGHTSLVASSGYRHVTPEQFRDVYERVGIVG